jgi:hypothetical protein|tara:strand:+ start:557 stop:754 length:198 start_codon:yes stop_codon:yes gene_type:complete
MSNEIEYRLREVEGEVKHHDAEISKISTDLSDIKHLIAQIRWFITGGILFLMADRIGFFAALGIL